ncbi:MAG TPA: ATP-binding protein [Longimicrobiales bacterium]|nr:ATP-binding protein [Longimicrobiales bacterium]
MIPAAARAFDRDGSEVERALYRPVRARLAVALWALALGAVFRLTMSLPLDPRFFGLTVLWIALVAAAFQWLVGHRDVPFFFPMRFAVFSFEVLVAAWLAHYIGASSWLATLFLLFPAIEWNMLYPGAWGLAGSVLAILATGALIVGEAVGFVPAGALFSGIEPEYAEPRYALGAFFVSASVIAGLSTVVGRYAEAGRRQARELGGANARLFDMSEDLRESHAESEAAYRQLREAQAELVSAAKMASLGTLIAGVAHEINTPLGALNSNHDTIRRAIHKLQAILEDEVVEEHELDGVRRIVKALDGVSATNNMAMERMVKMVDSLRTFGRVDRSEIDRVDLHEGIESTLAIMAHELKDRITVVREYGVLPLVECYPNQIHQVVMNLILNGIQAMPEKGTVTIRTRSEGSEVALEVEDTGVGIPREHLARVFDPGFTTKGSRMGMGMGLLITSQIVDRHGGRLTVESEPGEGTNFTVHLPVRLRVREATGGTGAPRGAGHRAEATEPAGGVDE